jgi:hypothetical protein
MERRSLGAGLMVLASSLLLSVGTASAHGTASAQSSPEGTCQITSQPSFVLQGEFEQTATAADVIEVGCNPLEYGTGSKVTVIASQLYDRCNGHIKWYVPNPYQENWGRSIELTLDADGNATVALIAGPKCQAGEGLITLHMDEGSYESFTTSFTALPPVNTPTGVTAIPSSQIEDAESSGVVTIIEAEFPGNAESYVRLGSEELYRRCGYSPHLTWVREDGDTYSGPELAEDESIQLDNNGNGFALAIGDSSCAEGLSLIEADLESKPFTTLTTGFTVLSPQPRV